MQHPSLPYVGIGVILMLALIGLMGTGVNYFHTQEVLRTVYSAVTATPLIP